MKPRLAFLLCLYITFSGSAQITFPVCDVKPADSLLAEVAYREVNEFLTLRDKENYHADFYSNDANKKPVPNPRLEAYPMQPYSLIHPHGQHPLVLAAQLAYAQHRPLVLSPDMIWLLILQGFAAHVDANGEALRDYFVAHEGKKVLCVQRDDYVRGDSLFPWPEVFKAFSVQIGQHTDTALVQLASEGFSTTGPAERAAFEVALMDAMSTYFLYAIQIICGIPEITLEGTPSDWAALEERTAALGKYELEWWTDGLQPILKEFTLASKGQVRTEFWQDIFQLRSGGIGCGSAPFITGWILQFFPYIHKKANPWVNKPEARDSFFVSLDKAANLLSKPKTQKILKKKGKGIKTFLKQKKLYGQTHPTPGDFGLPAIELSDLPMGISNADLVVDFLGQKLAYKLQAGFIGIQQDQKTMNLRPEISWLVIDTGQAPSEEDVELYEKWLREGGNADR